MRTVVTTRQDDMKSMSADARALNDFFVGKRKYAAAGFRTLAASIAKRAGSRLVSHFKDVVVAQGSDAGPEIATNFSKFEVLAYELQSYATRVGSAAAEGDAMPESMRMRPAEMLEGGPCARRKANRLDVASFTSEHAFHMMLQTCTSCHAEFRERR